MAKTKNSEDKLCQVARERLKAASTGDLYGKIMARYLFHGRKRGSRLRIDERGVRKIVEIAFDRGYDSCRRLAHIARHLNRMAKSEKGKVIWLPP